MRTVLGQWGSGKTRKVLEHWGSGKTRIALREWKDEKSFCRYIIYENKKRKTAERVITNMARLSLVFSHDYSGLKIKQCLILATCIITLTMKQLQQFTNFFLLNVKMLLSVFTKLSGMFKSSKTATKFNAVIMILSKIVYAVKLDTVPIFKL